MLGRPDTPHPTCPRSFSQADAGGAAGQGTTVLSVPRRSAKFVHSRPHPQHACIPARRHPLHVKLNTDPLRRYAVFTLCRSAPYAVCQARHLAPIATAIPGHRDAAAGTRSRRRPACRAHQDDLPAVLATHRKSGGGRVRGLDKGVHDPHQTARIEVGAGPSAAANNSQGANLGVRSTLGRDGENAGSAGTCDAIPSTSYGAANIRAAATDSAPAPPPKLKVAYSMGGREITCTRSR